MQLRWRLILSPVFSAILVLFGGPAHAQQAPGRPARIAWVSVFPLPQVASYLDAFRSGLVAEGYVEGRDVEVLARSAN
jgi:putative tryptophan/tyrosine transport system substrate-binding protein